MNIVLFRRNLHNEHRAILVTYSRHCYDKRDFLIAQLFLFYTRWDSLMKNYALLCIALLASSSYVLITASDAAGKSSKDSLACTFRSIHPVRYPDSPAVINAVLADGTSESLAEGGRLFYGFGAHHELAIGIEKQAANLVFCDHKNKKAMLVDTTFQMRDKKENEPLNRDLLAKMSACFFSRGYQTTYHGCGRVETDKALQDAGWQHGIDKDNVIRTIFVKFFEVPYCDNTGCYEYTPCQRHKSEPQKN